MDPRRSVVSIFVVPTCQLISEQEFYRRLGLAKKDLFLSRVLTRLCSQNKYWAKISITFVEVECDIELSSKKIRKVPLPPQAADDMDSPTSSEKSITDPERKPSTYLRASPHPRKALLKPRTSNDSSNSNTDSSSSMTKLKCGFPDCDRDEDPDQLVAWSSNECSIKIHKTYLPLYLDDKGWTLSNLQRRRTCAKKLSNSKNDSFFHLWMSKESSDPFY